MTAKDRPKSKGQQDYEKDVAERPKYHDGTPRKTWDQLDPTAQWTWERGEQGKS